MKKILFFPIHITFIFICLELIFLIDNRGTCVAAADKSSKQALRVSPVIIELPLKPGAKINKEITVTNLSVDAIPLTAFLEPLETGDDADNPPNQIQTSPLPSWIHLDPQDMILDPGTSRIINMTVDIPDHINVGGYYAMVSLSPLQRTGTVKTAQIQSQIGVIILGSIGVSGNEPAEKTGQISYFNLKKPSYDFGESPEFSIRVKNISLSHFSAKPLITFIPLWTIGKPEAETQIITEKIILPGKSRVWDETARLGLKTNLYQVKLGLSLGSGRILNAQTYVFIGPWKQIIFITFSVIFIFGLIKYHKRFKKAVKELFG